MNNLHIAYFGGPQISVDFAERLVELGITPKLIVTTPDKPAGRKMILTPPPLKVWAEERDIKVIQPDKLSSDKIEHALCDITISLVVAYGKIIPQSVLELSPHGFVNFHPSLLPKYRGASPIITALLADDRHTGISLMKLDSKMDHGPLLAQKEVLIDEWKKNRVLEHELATIGAELLVELLPEYIQGDLELSVQDHSQATFTPKYSKADMQVSLEEPRDAYLKYCAFDKPFFFSCEKRIVITDAEWKDEKFVIKKVIPEAKKEVTWEQFLASRQEK